MKRTLTLALLLVELFACTDEKEAHRTLDAFGFSDIAFTGYDWNRCGEGDTTATGFIAKSPKGRVVTGTVCCGWLKACTVRF